MISITVGVATINVLLLVMQVVYSLSIVIAGFAMSIRYQ